MDFFKKQTARFGKKSEHFEILFRPLILKVNVFTKSDFYLIYKRGPKKDETKKYTAEPASNGLQMQQIEFKNEEFIKISNFYRDKDDKYQAKKADLKIMCQNSIKEETICSFQINLSQYINRGVIKDSIQLSGNGYFLDFEISVTPESQVDHTKRGTVATFGNYDHDEGLSDEDTAETMSRQTLPAKSNPILLQQQMSLGASGGQHQIAEIKPQPLYQSQSIQQQKPMSSSTLSQEQPKQMEEMKKQVADMQKRMQELQLQNSQLASEKEDITKELTRSKEAQQRWADRCKQLEQEVEKLKKENEDFYNADKFNY